MFGIKRKVLWLVLDALFIVIGLVVAVDPSEVDTAIATLKANGEEAYVIGEVVSGTEGVEIC